MSSDRYEIQKKIGEGGAGSVYLAVDTRLDREVAIKRLMAEEDGNWTQSTVDMMLKEARLLSSIDHPNIVTIYDADVDEDGPYVVMELLQGRNMDELIAENPMTAADFKAFSTHCLEALSAAHSINVIHRDIKPNNIVLKWLPNGRFQAKLLDFGMAKLSQVPTKQTVDHGGSVMGSIYFMAPEQFERLELDARTDIYALGAVFYYTLTGAYPFTGETAAEVMAAHLTHRVQPIAELRPDLPEWVCNWIMWLINREMQHRPESAQIALDYFQANDDEIPLRSSDKNSNISKTTGVIQIGQPVAVNTSAQKVGAAAGVAKPTLLTASGSLSKASTTEVSVPQENITKPQEVRSTPATAGVKLNTAPTSGIKLITGSQAVAATTVAAGNKTAPQAAPAHKTQGQPTSVNTASTNDDKKDKPKNKLLVPLIIGVVFALIAGWIVMTQLGKNKVINQYNTLIKQADGENPSRVVTSKPDFDFLTSKLYGANSTFDSGHTLRRLLIADSDGTYDLGDEIASFATQDGNTVSDETRSDLLKIVETNDSEASVDTLINFIKSSDDESLIVDAIRACRGGATFTHLDFFVNNILQTKNVSERQASEHIASHIIKNTKQRSAVIKAITGAMGNANNPITKASITRLIGSLGGEEAKEIILEALNSGNNDTIIPALGAISEWKDDSMIDPTIDFWLTSPSDKIRKTAFESVYNLMTRFHVKKEQKTSPIYWDRLAGNCQTSHEKLLIINALATANKPYSLKYISSWQNDENDAVSKRAKGAIQYLKNKNGQKEEN